MSTKVAAPSRAESPDRWMISYADLLTLTLAFFIVMYAQSTVNVAKFERLAAALAVAFHGTPSLLTSQAHGAGGILKQHHAVVHPPVPATPAAGMSSGTLRGVANRAAALRTAEARLQSFLAPMIRTREVRLQDGPLSIRITLNSRILFGNGVALLQPAARDLLTRVAGVIKGVPTDYPVVVQGYTNRIPIATAQFPSNWELSAARAISVVHLFMGQGIPGTQLSVQGFAQYHPLKGITGQRAIEENRRVEIVILAPSAQRVSGTGSQPATSSVPDLGPLD
ncbi:MAG TPA: flagellar motor protein MotB [Rhodanobacteraceae bacterium]